MRLRIHTLTAVLACALVVAAAATAGSARPLRTAIVDGASFSSPASATAFARTRATGASVVRLTMNWRQIAPPGKQRPAAFVATNPGDPLYNWAAVDAQVKGAVDAGLQPLLYVQDAPDWVQTQARNRAQDGPYQPRQVALAEFARAAATRYGGKFEGLPRVSYWQVWNEPNVSIYLLPQRDQSRLASPVFYRGMVNRFADAVHAVHRDNLVVAGGLSPFSVFNRAVETIGPLAFMQAMLCVTSGPHPKSACQSRVRFDVWSIHPYTSGNPTHKARNANDLSLGDIAKVRPLLNAAVRLHHLSSIHPIGFWVTEFSYDTKPPDPHAVPIKLQTRWTSEALYRAWKAGVSLFTWFLLRDEPLRTSDFQSGLYFRGASFASDRPKPTLTAFRSPFVAFTAHGKVTYWGRNAKSKAGPVTIQQTFKGGWRRAARVRADRFGIFSGALASRAKTGSLRAVAADGSKSQPFSLVVPKDYAVSPFGVGSNK